MQQHTSKFWYVFLMSFSLSLGAILLSMLSYLYLNSEVEENAINLRNERLAVAAQTVLDKRIQYLYNNLVFLTDLPRALSKNHPLDQSFQEFSDIFASFMEKQSNIDQLRLIGLDGKERIRINRIDTKTIKIATADQLQDKMDRYYFTDAINLPKGGLAVSRLDLNVERGAVEIPYRPTMRLSMPIFDIHEQKLGVVVINYHAQEMLNELIQLRKDDRQTLWLTDEKLDWIIAPEGQNAWATQLQLPQGNLQGFLPNLADQLTRLADFQGAMTERGQQFFTVFAMPFKPILVDKNVPMVLNRTPHLHLIVGSPKPLSVVQRLLHFEEIRSLFMQLNFLALAMSLLLGWNSSRRQELQTKFEFQEALIKDFISHAPDLMLIIDDQGGIIYQNLATERLLKRLELTELGTQTLDIFDTTQRQGLYQKSRNQLSSKEDVFFKDGERFRFYQCQFFFIKNHVKQPYLAVLFSEHTDLMETKLKLAESENQIRQMLESAPDGIIVSNANGQITLTNRKAQELFEMDEATFLQNNIDNLVPHPYKNEHKHLRQSFFDAPKLRIMSNRPDIIGRTATGRTFFAEISLSPIKIAGEMHVMAIVRDISERKRIERHLKQTQKMDALGQLTGGIAHDFNNLLTAIIGNLDLAKMLLDKKPDKTEQISQKIDTSLSASLKAANLTKRLLAFARQSTLAPKLVNIGEVIQEEFEIIQSIAGKAVEVELSLEPHLCPIKVDQEELVNAVVNLVTNAKDAMPNGGHLYISLENDRLVSEKIEVLGIEIPPGDYVTLSISDTGEGIKADILDKIFEPFFTTKQKYHGTGLGLSMVFGFIKQSNGYLKVYSEENIGTTFKLYFRCVDLHSPEIKDSQHKENQVQSLIEETTHNYSTGEVTHRFTLDNEVPEESHYHHDQNGRILVVDDEDSLLTLAREYLSEAGYQVYSAQDASSAMQILEKFPMDLVVTDIVMPGKNGFELALDIEEKFPSMPIVFSSGFPESALKHTKGYKQNIILLSKPYRKHQLLKITHLALHKKLTVGGDSA